MEKELKLECLKLSKEILENGLSFIAHTSKQGKSRESFCKLLDNFSYGDNENFWLLLDRSSSDEVVVNNHKATPSIIKIIYFANRLYEFCISDQTKLDKIIEDIVKIKKEKKEEKEKIEKEKKEEKEKIEKEKKELINKIKQDKENEIIKLEDFLFQKIGCKYNLDRNKSISELKEYVCNEILNN